ncbi:hypothetical protein R1flu_000266 [Riccia fluitans]|uniref:Uncharacterized protein n=1 Tax=Riccia fluitans TaxID=41844 RepID=A0ABD1XZZ4_9MARC
MGLIGNRRQFCSFVRWRKKSRQTIGTSKTFPEPRQEGLDVRSVDSEPYRPKNLDFEAAKVMLRRHAGDGDFSDHDPKVDESRRSSSIKIPYDQRMRAVDYSQKDYAAVGNLTVDVQLPNAPEEQEGSVKSPLLHSERKIPASCTFQETGDHVSPVNAVTKNSGPISIGYMAEGSGLSSTSTSNSGKVRRSSSNSKTSCSDSGLDAAHRGRGSRMSLNSNSGGDRGSTSSTEFPRSGSESDCSCREDFPLTESSSAVLSPGPIHERMESDDRWANMYGKEEDQTAEHEVGSDEAGGSPQHESTINNGQLRVISLDQDRSESGKDNWGWYIHWSKSAQCISNHYQLRPIMDVLRYWRMEVPGTVNIRYTHSAGVEVSLPWPDLRSGSREQIHQFVDTVNRTEGRQVFYYLFMEHPRGFIRNRSEYLLPPSPTSVRTSGSYECLPPPSPRLTSVPNGSICGRADRLVGRESTRASGSKMFSRRDTYPTTVPRDSRRVQKYLLYHV